MSSLNNKLINIFIVAFSIFLVTILLLNAEYFTKFEKNNPRADIIKNEIDISKIISDFSLQNVILSQNENSEFVSLITINDELNHETVLISSKTGKEIGFEDIIIQGYLDKFWDKVYDLLELKYPKFIIDGLQNTEGNIYYEIKDNEMIIYFEKFTFEVDYTDIISIKVNYNEIKEYLNFPTKLDLEYENESAYHYDKNKKTIAFSFDDGPNNLYTKEIANVLIENKAKATFFMIGNKMDAHKESLMYVYENGFEIGSHTYNHINMKRETISKVKEELKKTNDTYYGITGSYITLVRPPYGAYNSEVVNAINYPLITWNIDTNDWRYHNSDYIVNHIMENVSDGSIILMHDSYESTLDAVKKALPKLCAEGYQIVTISDLAALKGITIEDNKVYSYFR